MNPHDARAIFIVTFGRLMPIEIVSQGDKRDVQRRCGRAHGTHEALDIYGIALTPVRVQ